MKPWHRSRATLRRLPKTARLLPTLLALFVVAAVGVATAGVATVGIATVGVAAAQQGETGGAAEPAAETAPGPPHRPDLTLPPGGLVPWFYSYDPPSTLVVPETEVTRARYPFIDVHNHQRRLAEQDLDELVSAMDRLNMAVMVNLSGRGFRRVENPDGTTSWGFEDGSYLARAVERVGEEAPGRIVVFTNVDFSGVGEAGWAEAAVAQLERDVAAGARGLKIYKSLGMTSRDVDGERIPVDDPRLDPIWAKAGELGIPVLIHSADPAPFWQPRDAGNERLLELMERPRRYRAPGEYPPWETIIGEQHALFRNHPGTTFINAHLGWLGHDLASLGELLDELPNVYTEIGAVLAELGRQPRFARQWMTRYQDRVLFGKDSWNPDEYHTYFRVLETDDEYFPYYRQRHAFWRMYGLDLPDRVLKKLYFGNALRIIPGLDPGRFPTIEDGDGTGADGGAGAGAAAKAGSDAVPGVTARREAA